MPQEFPFQELFLEQLNDLYSAETQVISFLPQINAVTSSGDLREEFDIYLRTLLKRVEKLNNSLQEIKASLPTVPCEAIAGMLKEAGQIMHHGGNSAVKDAGLIAITQRIIHFKIAVYGTARTYARHLNLDKIMNFCQLALNDEIETDKKLSRLAEGGIFTTGINEEACKSIH